VIRSPCAARHAASAETPLPVADRGESAGTQ